MNCILHFSDEALEEEAEEGTSDGDPDKRWKHQPEGGMGQEDVGKASACAQRVRSGRDDRHHWCHQGKRIQG